MSVLKDIYVYKVSVSPALGAHSFMTFRSFLHNIFGKVVVYNVVEVLLQFEFVHKRLIALDRFVSV